MNKHYSFILSLLLVLICSCEGREPQNNSSKEITFTNGSIGYYGDIYNLGTNVLSLSLYSSDLALDSTGINYVGTGENLIFDDLFISSNELLLTDGIYQADSAGNAFTFLPGKNNYGIASGAYLTTVSKTQTSKQYIASGQFTVENIGDSTIIDFELKTDSKKKIEGNFRGILPWADVLPD